MLSSIITFINPITSERFVVSLRPLDGNKLINKYYPQLQFAHFDSSNNNYNFVDIIAFIFKRFGSRSLEIGLNALSSIVPTCYKGQLSNSKEVNDYVMDIILKLASGITTDIPNWRYVQKTCSLIVYELIFSAIEHKNPYFGWNISPDDNFGQSFIIYRKKGKNNLTNNDFAIINRLIKADTKGCIIDIISTRQKMTNYRKRIERIYLEDDLHTEPDDIFLAFPFRGIYANQISRC